MLKFKFNFQKIKRWFFLLKRNILTPQRPIIFFSILAALILAVSAVNSIERNYKQQRRLNAKLREAKILQLQAENLEFEQDYFRSNEYQEIALRQKTNLALPGETMLILSKPSAWVAEKHAELDKKATQAEQAKPSNFELWLDFFFGAKETSL